MFLGFLFFKCFPSSILFSFFFYFFWQSSLYFPAHWVPFSCINIRIFPSHLLKGAVSLSRYKIVEYTNIATIFPVAHLDSWSMWPSPELVDISYHQVQRHQEKWNPPLPLPAFSFDMPQPHNFTFPGEMHPLKSSVTNKQCFWRKLGGRFSSVRYWWPQLPGDHVFM